MAGELDWGDGNDERIAVLDLPVGPPADANEDPRAFRTTSRYVTVV